MPTPGCTSWEGAAQALRSARAHDATQAAAVPLSSVVVLRSPLRHLCNTDGDRSSPTLRKGRATGGASGVADKENSAAVHFAAGRACITPGGSLRVSPLSSNVSEMSDATHQTDTPTKALTFGSLA